MNEELRLELAMLAAEYRAALVARLARLEVLARECAGGAARAGELQRELHSIAGSGKTFGLPAVTDAARATEAFVETQCLAAPPGAGAWQDLQKLLETLARAARA